jgi:hypothetical protein
MIDLTKTKNLNKTAYCVGASCFVLFLVTITSSFASCGKSLKEGYSSCSRFSPEKSVSSEIDSSTSTFFLNEYDIEVDFPEFKIIFNSLPTSIQDIEVNSHSIRGPPKNLS